jgi:LysM repeat protein
VDLTNKLRLSSDSICNHQYENAMYEYHRVQKGDDLKSIAKQYRITLTDFCQWNGIDSTFVPVENTSLKVYHRKSRTSIADLISEMLIYSDNESYNKLFEILGGGKMQNWFIEKNLEKSNVTRKFLFCEGEEKSYSVSYDILNDRDIIFYHGLEQTWTPADNSKIMGIKVGKQHYYDGKLINSPRDFSDHNRISLGDLHETMQRLLFPSLFVKNEQFELDLKSTAFLIKRLGMYPSEDRSPRDSCYDKLEDGKNIYLFNGNRTNKIENNIRIINIVGQSYGFSTDCMYFTDEATNTEFMLSARIYTNKNEILGDDKYEYETIAMPLMEALGNYLFEKEKKRTKEVLPNFAILRSLFD